MRTPSAVAAALTGLVLAAGAAQAGKGDIVTTKVGCRAPEPYAKFEKVYKEKGNMPAYKALLATGKCGRLQKEIEVKLIKAVDSFDYGWGKGKVWEVKPMTEKTMAPDPMYIRIQEGS